MLYWIVTYDPDVERPRAFVATGRTDAEAFDKVARLVPTVAEYGAAVVRLSDFLSDVGEVSPAKLDELDGLTNLVDLSLESE